MKVNGLLVVYYLAYYLLVQKETFFNSNRWFLLSGLLTSILLPLFFITKVVLVRKTPKNFNAVPTTNSNFTSIPEETLDWSLIISGLYLLISCIFILFIISNLYSFFKLIHKKQVEINKPFALIDIYENINPFSFFKYIVFNSTLYSKTELDSILNHEKVHSREKHSIDVLIAKVFCAVFWFNPFIWLYKKAIFQNLEYIADQKAIQNIKDKKAYQMTLLRAITDHNCLSITNNFYQSLIKKRIVMLNKNQSQKLNSWKYFLVIPVLVAFIFLFQIKVEAHEKQNDVFHSKNNTDQVTEVIITKNSTDKELKSDCKQVKKQANIDLKVSKVKRNSKGEITRIQVSFDDNNGTKSEHNVESDVPITSFKFVISKDKNGKGEVGFYDISEQTSNSDNENYLVENSDFPEPPTPPQTFIGNMPAPPSPPAFPAMPNVKTPTDPNDQKGWNKYEAEMDAYAKRWENNEMKKYETEMEDYGRKMEALQPDMTEFDKKMEEFESKMRAYQEKMDEYQEKIRDAADAKSETAGETKKEAITERKVAITNRKIAITARKVAITARKESQIARENSETYKRDSIDSKK